MAKTLYQEITKELIHSVATLIAAGHRTNTINLKLGVSLTGIKRIQAMPEWDNLLASKEAAIGKLMAGDA